MGEVLGFGAYHGTDLESAVNISKEKIFDLSQKSDEWLGKGIYFWDTLADALWWVQDNNKCKNSPAIVTVFLNVQSEQYFDLDQTSNMDKLLDYVDEYDSEMKRYGHKKPNFTNNKQIRNFYCSLYKEQYSIKLMKFTFKYQDCNKAGFPHLIERVQLCASDNSIITILKFRGVDYAI